ncbi:MAG TPA: NlpC/P60 family protein [Balneolaceae bacterium]
MVSRLQTVLLVLFTAWVATGCGMVRHSVYRPPSPGADTAPATVPVNSESQESPVSEKPFSSLNEVQVKLMEAYREWKGTPYQLGGASKSGIDCSQLVQIIFNEYLGISLPPTTRTQLNAGEGIRRAAIRTGDLVFFRTGRKSLHVGIALNHGEFLHASASEGVMISKLGNHYWRNRFLAARRVL